MTEGCSLIILILERLTQVDWDSLGYCPYPVSKLKYNSYMLPSLPYSGWRNVGPQGLCPCLPIPCISTAGAAPYTELTQKKLRESSDEITKGS